jgi:hypothetical protein
MIHLRSLVPSDLTKLDELWREHWSSESSLPNLRTRITDAVAVDKRRIVGYGQVKQFAELMMFVDPTTSTRTRAEATKLLMDKALRDSRAAGLPDVYCFVRDADFSLIVQKHFGFEKADDPGELLLKKLE